MEAKGDERFNPNAPYAPAATIAFAAYSACCGEAADDAARNAAASIAYVAGPYGQAAWSAALASEEEAQCRLLRDLFGSPFRRAVADPAWLAWNEGAIGHIARTIYEERRFHDLSILADALEEAGCNDPDILAHCRGPGEHTRGCWVLDLLLGRT